MRSFLFPTIALMILSGCGGSEPPSKPQSKAPAVAVQTVTVASQQWPDVYEATGTVRARSTAVLSSKVMAYVRQIDAQVGDAVHAGQTLITLDSQDLDSSVRRAEIAETEVQSAIPAADHAIAASKASLDLAQSTFQRMQELADKKSISRQEFDEASARLKSAQAAYDMALAKRAELDPRLAQVREDIRAARIQRDYAHISAPFSGVVTARSVEPGNLAAPGTPLLTIEQAGAYRLEASVEESKLPFVKNGQAVEVSLEALDRKLTARVSEIVPTVDAASRAYIVKIDLPASSNLRSGMFGCASFPMGSRKLLAIPAQAVVMRGQLQSVYVVEDGFVHARLITTGTRVENAVESLSGLSEGERIVVPIPAGLADGSPVEVRP